MFVDVFGYCPYPARRAIVFGVGPASFARPEARNLGLRGSCKESHILRLRLARSAGWPAVNAGGHHAVDKLAVKARIPGGNGVSHGPKPWHGWNLLLCGHKAALKKRYAMHFIARQIPMTLGFLCSYSSA
jgi:hypothetical protein